MRGAPLLAILGMLALAVPTGAPAANDATPRLRSGHGIHVDSFEQLDARQLHARVSTNALQQPVDVRVLLPAGYADAPKRRYPVLYLFHGTSGRASDWIEAGEAVETTEGLPLIVVMPDAGFDGDGGGWFADWFNGGRGGPPKWETFHIEQVIPWIDDNLRTIDERAGRAVAGLSQGGFGALSYAARHPELFTSVASFSGGCVIDRDPQAIAVSTQIIKFTTAVLSGIADEDAIFGPRETQELNWQAHDPGTLVTNLRGMQIALWTGDGTPGPFDPVPVDPGASSIEAITFRATELFHGYLMEVGIPHTYTYYGGGTHIFAYWARDLREYMGPLMRRFRHSPRRPKSIGYLTTARRWEQWDWRVDLDLPEPAFNHLDRARRRGFELSGTGDAVVHTPPIYRPRAHYRVSRRTATSSLPGDVVRAGSNGRLRIDVPLPSGTVPDTIRVRIRPAGSAR